MVVEAEATGSPFRWQMVWRLMHYWALHPHLCSLRLHTKLEPQYQRSSQ